MHPDTVLWAPSAQQIEYANLTRFMKWLAQHHNLHFTDYTTLWRWSTEDIDAFWGALWEYFDIQASTPYTRVLGKRTMPGAEWFPGAHLNYAEHVLRNEVHGGTALMYANEYTPIKEMSWSTLAGKVRILATQLRNMGVKPGDRVVAWMPNIPETFIAMLATTAIGGIWACCSPDFGARGVLDRLAQLEPKVLFCVDGYQYGGKAFNRLNELRQITALLPSLRQVIHLPYLNPDDITLPDPRTQLLHDVLHHASVSAAEFKFEQVPFAQPLWTLFSSGTTGLPKPIIHSHGGILMEQLKNATFHFDLHRGERILFYSTSGWMLWNFLVSTTLCGAVPVLYDGSASHPQPDTLWTMAATARVQTLGSSPTYVEQMSRAGIQPKKGHDLCALRSVVLSGSPATPETIAWFYEHVKQDLWVVNGSGGTDMCTGFVGGVPIQPVRAGEIQGPSLGVAIKAFNEKGESVIDEVGELVITEPMPSMPLGFWKDDGNQRYLEAYFNQFPGMWRHGDFFKINARGGCFVLGRSDATLNRFGIRIGTAEIYRTLALQNEVADSLIINIDLPDGGFFMPLFVKLKPGVTLTPDIEASIKNRLRTEYTPRHVPDKIYQVPAIPVTITGKKMEVPIRRILMGYPADNVANLSAMANPESLDWYINYANEQTDYSLKQA